MQQSRTKTLKLCVLGDVGVGKTSLTERFITGIFNNKYRPTYHGNHYHKRLETPDGDVYIQVWDTSGTGRFRSISPHMLGDSNGALLTYDVTSLPTFSSVQLYWLDMVKTMAPVDFRMILVGNKVDRSLARQVDEEMARRFCKEQGLVYYETSAKDGQNVELAFLEAVSLLGQDWDVSGDFCKTFEVATKSRSKMAFCNVL